MSSAGGGDGDGGVGQRVRPSGRRRLLRGLLPYQLLAPSLVALALLLFCPLLLSAWIGLHDVRIGESLLGSKFIGLKHYVTMFQAGSPVLRSLWITLRYVVWTICIEVTVGLGLAMALSNNVPGITLIRTLGLLPMMTTPAVLGVIFRLLFDHTFGWYNYFLSLVGIAPRAWTAESGLALGAAIFAECWRGIPLIMVMLIAGISALPRSVYEAARIDGAGGFQTFRHVTLPLLRPLIVLGLIIRSTDAVHSFDQIYTLTRGGPGRATEVLSLAVYRTAIDYQRLGSGVAMSWILMFMSAAFGYLFIRFYREYGEG